MPQYAKGPSEKFLQDKQPKVGWPWRMLSASVVLFIFVAVVYLGLIFGYKPFLKSEIGDLNKQLDALTQEITENEQENFVSFYSQAANIKGILDGHVVGSKIFPIIEKVTHSRVYYSSLSIAVPERLVSLDGVAESYDTLISQLALYESAPEIKRMTLGASQTSSEGLVTFQVRLEMQPELFKPLTAGNISQPQ